MKRLLFFILICLFGFSSVWAQDSKRRSDRLPVYFWDFSHNDDSQRGGLKGTFTNADATNRNYISPTTGYLVTAGANEPRHMWADGVRALLVEPAGENVILQSRTFTHASWTQYSYVTIAMDETGIDGIPSSAGTCGDGNASATGYLRQSFACGNNTNTHCASVFIKKDSNTSRFPSFLSNLTGGTTQSTRVVLNTQTGATYKKDDTNDDDSVGCVDMADYGLDGWWRLWVTNTNVADGNTDIKIYIIPAYGTAIDGGPDNAATGSIVCDQAQVELNQKFPSMMPIVTTVAAASRTSEAGYPTFTIPAKGSGTIFSEHLDAELVTDGDCSSDSFTQVDPGDGITYDAVNDEYDIDGSQTGWCYLYQADLTTSGTVYKISATISNYNAGTCYLYLQGGLGNAITGDGTYTEYLTASDGNTYNGIRIKDDFEGSIDDISVKQVTNPSSEGGPPRGTVIVWWRPSVDYNQHGDTSVSGILQTYDSGSGYGIFYVDGVVNNIKGWDNTTAATSGALNYAAGTWYKAVYKYAYLSSNVAKQRMGVDSGSGVSWGTEVNDDGARTTGATINIGAGLNYPFHIRAIEIFPDEILSDTVIDAGGSP